MAPVFRGRLLPRLRLDTRGVVIAVVVAIIGYLVVVPLAYLVWQTFRHETGFGLEGFRQAYEGTGLGSLVGNSLLFAVGATAVAVVTGVVLAHLVTRTDLPLRGMVSGTVVAPIVLPGVLHTIAWVFLASPRTGLINTIWNAAAGQPVLDVFSMTGMIVVEGLHSVPLAFLLMAAAFRAVDPGIEEAALTEGATPRMVLWRITLPSVRPALLGVVLLMMIRSLEAFEVPALLGIPARRWVFTSRIWSALRGYPLRLDEAGALSIPLLGLTLVGVILLRRFTTARADFQTVTGGARRASRLALGRWRVPAIGVVALYLLVTVVLPLAMLGYVSTQPYYSAPSVEALLDPTLENYRRVFGGDDSIRAVRNSIILGVGSASAVMAMSAVAAWFVVRSRARGRGLVDGLGGVPLVIPGLVAGLALLVLYLRVPLPIFGTLWILGVAYVTRYLPYGLRSAASAMYQIGDDLEEAAFVAGASWWQTMRLVHVPLMLPGLGIGWIYIFLVSMRELSSSILLYSPGREVVAVLIMDQWLGGRIPELAALGVVMVVALAGFTSVMWLSRSRFGPVSD